VSWMMSQVEDCPDRKFRKIIKMNKYLIEVCPI
jgi:hypothetical protein